MMGKCCPAVGSAAGENCDIIWKLACQSTKNCSHTCTHSPFLLTLKHFSPLNLRDRSRNIQIIPSLYNHAHLLLHNHHPPSLSLKGGNASLSSCWCVICIRFTGCVAAVYEITEGHMNRTENLDKTIGDPYLMFLWIYKHPLPLGEKRRQYYERERQSPMTTERGINWVFYFSTTKVIWRRHMWWRP